MSDEINARISPETYDELEEMWRRCKENIEANMQTLIENINRL